MILIILTIIIAAIFAGITDGEQWREKWSGRVQSQAVEKTINSIWHNTQFMERCFILLTGMIIAFETGLNWLLIDRVALAAIIFFIVNDGVQNLLKGQSFFHVSTTTTALTEPFAAWYYKIPVLIIILVSNFIF
jgi:hypothetical protein